MAFIHVKLDVEYAADPKIIRAGAHAELLYVRALALGKRLMSDGYIDAAHLPQLALGLPGKPDKYAQALITEGLWSTTPGGFQIVSWAKHNASREQIETVRSRKQEAAAIGNHKRWHSDDNPSPSCRYCFAQSSQSARTQRNGSDRPEEEEDTEEEEETRTPPPRTTSTEGHPAGSGGCPKCRREVINRGNYTGPDIASPEGVIRHRAKLLHAEGYCKPPPDPELTQAASFGAASARSGSSLGEVKAQYAGAPLHVQRAAVNAFNEAGGQEGA